MTIMNQSVSARDTFYALLSFGITIFRIGIALLFGICLVLGVEHSVAILPGVVALIMFADHLDGKFFGDSIMAENKDWRIKRRVFDSVADRIVIQLVSLSVLFAIPSFLPLYLLILLRESIISGYCTKLYRRGFVIYPNRLSKAACVTVGFTVITFVAAGHIAGFLMAFIMLLSAMIALDDYLRRAASVSTALSDALKEPVEIE